MVHTCLLQSVGCYGVAVLYGLCGRSRLTNDMCWQPLRLNLRYILSGGLQSLKSIFFISQRIYNCETGRIGTLPMWRYDHGIPTHLVSISDHFIAIIVEILYEGRYIRIREIFERRTGNRYS